MSRELRRLLIEPERLQAAQESAADAAVPLRPQERHYLERVLRYRPGDRFAVVDGAGALWSARLGDDRRAVLEQSLAAPLQQRPRPQPQLMTASRKTAGFPVFLGSPSVVHLPPRPGICILFAIVSFQPEPTPATLSAAGIGFLSFFRPGLWFGGWPRPFL